MSDSIAEEAIVFVMSQVDDLRTREFQGHKIISFHVDSISPQEIRHLEAVGIHLLIIQPHGRQIRVSVTTEKLQ